MAVSRCRAAFDLDADPAAVDAALGRDGLLATLVQSAPGRRVPGTVDGAELAMRAVLGQQISVRAARRIAGRLAEALGDPVPEPLGGVRRTFPSAAAVANVFISSPFKSLIGTGIILAGLPLYLFSWNRRSPHEL